MTYTMTLALMIAALGGVMTAGLIGISKIRNVLIASQARSRKSVVSDVVEDSYKLPQERLTSATEVKTDAKKMIGNWRLHRKVIGTMQIGKADFAIVSTTGLGARAEAERVSLDYFNVPEESEQTEGELGEVAREPDDKPQTQTKVIGSGKVGRLKVSVTATPIPPQELAETERVLFEELRLSSGLAEAERVLFEGLRALPEVSWVKPLPSNQEAADEISVEASRIKSGVDTIYSGTRADYLKGRTN